VVGQCEVPEGTGAGAVSGAVDPDEPEPVEGRLVEHRAEPLAEDAGVDEEESARVAWAALPVPAGLI
jgi:hypothetical protein